FCKVSQYKNLPGPIFSLPIIGYLPFLDPKVPYKTLTNLSKRYGPIYEIKLGSINTIVLSDANLIRDILKREEFTARAPLALTHGIMGGYGLICAEGLLWKDQRKLSIEWLKHLGMIKFGSNRNFLIKRIENGVTEFIQTLRNDSFKNLEINPMDSLHHTVGNILNDLVFGRIYSKDDSTWKYLQYLQEEGVKYIGVSGVVNFLPILRFLPGNQKIIKFLLDGKRKTHLIYDEIIENRLKKFQNFDEQQQQQQFQYQQTNNQTNEMNDNIEDLNNLCILDLFLKEKHKRELNNDERTKFCSSEQLRHLLADLFGAGVDTTLTTLRWFLLYMAKYQNYQTILRSKLMYLDKCDCLDIQKLENIPFLRACISETQRIRSVVPLGIPHGTIRDTIIQGNLKIKQNSMIIPLQWAVHMNEKIWNDPETFNPYRFINEEGHYISSQNFIPFQTGKRMCLGDELARMILLLYAGSILRNFNLSLPPFENINFEGECGITLTPPNHTFIFRE
ncbi:cytochrome P450 306a1, partial [Condylostylus longicornis]|uniref:cytochrome P450 306a1 n=1 Tax=Condylostylus longicornis TaxID=2530218 RepID=UPI00244E588B